MGKHRLWIAAVILTGCMNTGLRTGDLAFVRADAAPDSVSMSKAISSATGDVIHVAIVEVADGGVWVIDATDQRGVDRHPLDTLIADFTTRDGIHPRLEFKRLRNDGKVKAFIRKAKTLVGRPYDWYFSTDNDAYYCSELVWSCYEGVFPLRPMNFAADDGSYPAFWVELFDRLGCPIPQGAPGTNPQDLYDNPALVPVSGKIPKPGAHPAP